MPKPMAQYLRRRETLEADKAGYPSAGKNWCSNPWLPRIGRSMSTMSADGVLQDFANVVFKGRARSTLVLEDPRWRSQMT